MYIHLTYLMHQRITVKHQYFNGLSFLQQPTITPHYNIVEKILCIQPGNIQIQYQHMYVVSHASLS